VKRYFSVLLVIGLMSPFFFGCSGEDGAAGPAGSAGSPQPIKVLIAGAEPETSLKDVIASIYSYGAFPLGTEVDYFETRSAAPALTTLREYDVVVAYTNSLTSVGTAIGDVLADYADAGGKVVLLQYSFTLQATLPIQGRIMTAGYSPLQPAPAANILSNRSIDDESLTYPLHPIFNGTDVRNLVFFANNNTSNPALDATATLIALDSQGANAIAINAKGNIMALQVCGSRNSWDTALYPYSGILVANCCLFLAGAF
jgi:hypothetical protein